VRSIETDEFEIADRIELVLSSPSPQAIAKSMGLGLIGFGQSFSNYRPDVLVVLGDRYEMLTAALAALPFKLPVAHIAGGELTEGAIDDAIRHSISKLSHLHFTATREYANRVIQLGEDPSRVFVSGGWHSIPFSPLRASVRKSFITASASMWKTPSYW
jgi:UDP-hydrolysing UDP-N-acetyl-D-glucosamine 2-epimerase